MANNVDRVEIVASNDFRLSLERYHELVTLYRRGGKIPEGSFLAEFHPENAWLRQQDVRDGTIYIQSLWWSSDFSGHTVPLLLDILKDNFEGTADIVLTYESGEDEGYRIADGKAIQHEVIVALGDEV